MADSPLARTVPCVAARIWLMSMARESLFALAVLLTGCSSGSLGRDARSPDARDAGPSDARDRDSEVSDTTSDAAPGDGSQEVDPVDAEIADVGADTRIITDLGGTVLTINLGGASFPAFASKIGLNEEWTVADAVDHRAMEQAGPRGAPMISGLLEINNVDAGGPATSAVRPALFYWSGGPGSAIATRSDPNLDSLRTTAHNPQQQFINLLQLAGTCEVDGVFVVDNTTTKRSTRWRS